MSETKWAKLLTKKAWREELMSIVKDAKEAINLGVAAEQGLRHTIVVHSNSLQNLAYISSIADASQLVKNASSVGGIGVEGEGFKSLHIATGGEGLARPRMFTLSRRCVMAEDFRYRFGAEEGYGS